jgi:hypothetical protein
MSPALAGAGRVGATPTCSPRVGATPAGVAAGIVGVMCAGAVRGTTRGSPRAA